MYVVVPINQQFAFRPRRRRAVRPSRTDWDEGWLGRYQGLNSKVQTFNVNPAFSWKINNSFSLGAGVNYQYAKLNFSSAQNYGGALYRQLPG